MNYVAKHPEIQGTFKESNYLLGDTAAIRAEYEENGYLFLRNVLNQNLVAAVRQRFVKELQNQGFMNEDENWTGKDLIEIDENIFHDVLQYAKFLDDPSTRKIFELLLDAPLWIFKQVAIRMLPPTAGVYVLPPHQDGAYMDTKTFVNVWFPLDDITPETTGGVTVAAKSHLQGERPHVQSDRRPFKMGDIFVGGVPTEEISEPWLSADFHLGDILFFHPFAIHSGLPNLTSNKLRLSMDTRFQPFDDPRSHYAKYTAVEHKRIINEGGWPDETKKGIGTDD